MVECEVCKLVTNGCLSLVGLLFIAMGCLLPQECLISLIFLIIGAIIFFIWVVLCIVVALKDCTLSDLWYGFLDYLAETFSMLKIVAVIFMIIVLFVFAYMQESVPV